MMKVSHAIIFFFLLIIQSGFCVGKAALFSVTSYGAAGDGKTDDSPAFLKAWEVACSALQRKPSLYVPPGRTFMLKPLSFVGPCRSNTISFVVGGTIVAPWYTWNIEQYGAWISFSEVPGLIIKGGGVINGRGSLWWGRCGSKMDADAWTHGSSSCGDRPTAIHFHKCDGLKLIRLQHINSPRNHISINNCKNVDVSKLKIIAPGESPNTDGIDISDSTGINIHDSIISTGDDCVAINTGSSFINITRVFCGPGHGISIGSLGANGEYATVEEVKVRNCTFIRTDNGVRIKTYENGSGYARKITFEGIRLIASKNPIIIDQYYVNKMRGNNLQEAQAKGVKVSDITYKRVEGTSANELGITLKCNKFLGCTNIEMDGVHITAATPGQEIYSVCTNAHGSSSSALPSVACLAT